MAVGVLALVPIAAVGQEAGWPGLQGGPAHLGVAETPVEPPLEVRWRARSPSRDQALSAVAVTPDMAVANGRSAVIGFDPSTGTQRWEHVRAPGVLAPPAFARVTAPADGEEPGQGGGDREMDVVVTFEGTTADNSRVLGLDLSTGEELWRFDLNQAVVAAPAVDGEVAYVGGRDRVVYALQAATGELIWKSARLPDPIQASPAVSEGRVFVVSEDPSSGEARLSALDAATGRGRWSFTPEGLGVGSTAPAVAGGRVYMGFGDFTVRALDAARGTEVWASPTRAAFSPASAPAVSGSDLFVSDERGSLYRFDIRTGERVWDFQFDSEQTVSSPLVDGSVVLLGLHDGQAGAIEVSTGDLVWTLDLGTAPVGAFAPAGEVVLAPMVGAGGGVAALAHDPNGSLVRVESPTKLHLDRALLNFAVAFVILLVAVMAAFRWVPGLRPAAEPATGPIDPDDLEPSSPRREEP
jgi:outer membrane protein assembly factor BamB